MARNGSTNNDNGALIRWGAAVGIGSAALAAALLYAKSSRGSGARRPDRAHEDGPEPAYHGGPVGEAPPAL